jgi:serine/threonine protein kinase
VAPRISIPGFEVLAELGRGGMSVVFKARDLRLERLVAIKMLLAGELAHGDQQARFLNEARSLAALRHPHIVQIHEVGTANDRVFLAIEYVEGESLAQFLRHHALAPAAAARLTEKLARAVHHAHERGILHRDLKPGNVLLGFRRSDASEHHSTEVGLIESARVELPPDCREPIVVKIADFGLARRDNVQTMTQTGEVLGTPSYMPPEQASGRLKAGEPGPPADIYALGAILYEMLAGQPPFRGEHVLDTLDLVLTTDPIPPRKLKPRVPRDLETICLRCLEKLPSRRYPTARALAEDLRRFLENRPILARPTTRFERAIKWVRRHPTRAALFAVIFLGLLVIADLVVLHNLRLQREIDRAEAGERQAVTARRQADVNYQAAREAFRKQLDSLRAREHGGVPRISEYQKQQLEIALEFHQTVLRELANPTPSQRFDLASTAVDTARIRLFLGQYESAEKLLDQACALIEQLRMESPSEEGLLWLHAYAINSQGLARRIRGKLKEAEQNHRTAVGLWHELTDLHPENVEAQRLLIGARHSLATLLHSQGRFLEAGAEYDAAVAGLTALSNEPALRATYEPILGEVLVGIGVLQRQQGYNDAALQTWQRIEKLLAPQVQANPHDNDAALSLTSLYVNWGDHLQDMGQTEAGLEKLDEAVRLGEALVAREPKLEEAKNALGVAYASRGKGRFNLGRPLDASKDYDRAIELSPGSEHLKLRWDRLRMLALSNQCTRATAEARDLAAQVRPNAEQWYLLASVWAKCAGNTWFAGKLPISERQTLIKEYEDQALACLANARAAGYFANPMRAKQLRGDISSFGPLIVRPEFAKLCSELESAAPAGPKQ